MSQQNVDLVIAGHDHMYVRTKPINNVIYLTFIPAALSKFYPPENDLDKEPYVEKFYNYRNYRFKAGFTFVDVSGGSMTLKSYDSDNYLIDEFTLTK